MQDGERVLAHRGSLSDLAVGDVVDCWHQAGKEHKAWFRGRVASVDAAASTCDVVYYDKVVSTGQSSVRLLHPCFCFALIPASSYPYATSVKKTLQSYEPTCAHSNEDGRTSLGLRVFKFQSSFSFCVFACYGAFWLGWALVVLQNESLASSFAEVNYTTGRTLWLIEWGILTSCFFVIALRKNVCTHTRLDRSSTRVD